MSSAVTNRFFPPQEFQCYGNLTFWWCSHMKGHLAALIRIRMNHVERNADMRLCLRSMPQFFAIVHVIWRWKLEQPVIFLPAGRSRSVFQPWMQCESAHTGHATNVFDKVLMQHNSSHVECCIICWESVCSTQTDRQTVNRTIVMSQHELTSCVTRASLMHLR